MKVEKLELRNFRGIRAAEVAFGAQSAVIVGINGAGKTALLEALSLAIHHRLSPLPAERVELGNGTSGTKVPTTSSFDVREGAPSARIEVTFQTALEADTCALTLTPVGSEEAPGLATIDMDQSRRALAQDYGAQLLKEGAQIMPLFAYYSDRRHLRRLNPASAKEEMHRLRPEQTFREARIGFDEFFEWFLARESLENELLRENRQNFDPQLQAVRRACTAGVPGLTNLRIKRTKQKIVVDKDGVELDVGELSAGERVRLLLFADIGRRLAVAAPTAPDPLKAEGIVLIDEIELHLHPTWQRDIVRALFETFPGVQFIITTHSPQVLSDVKPAQVIGLEKTTDGDIVTKKVRASYGRDSNLLLLSVFDTAERPPQEKERLHRLFVLIDENKLEDARRLRDEIVDDLGPDEPDLSKADLLMRRRELMNRAADQKDS